jgi:hypothetical protein
LSGIGSDALLASLFGVPKVPTKNRMSDVDQVALKVQILNSEREYFPYSHSRRTQTKQIVPRGSSADETIRAISSAE